MKCQIPNWDAMRLVQLLVFLILFTVPCQSQTNDNIARKQGDDTAKADFVNFWHQFRDAVINFDTNQIMKHTEFPFQTRGPLDTIRLLSIVERNLFEFLKHSWANGMALTWKRALNWV